MPELPERRNLAYILGGVAAIALGLYILSLLPAMPVSFSARRPGGTMRVRTTIDRLMNPMTVVGPSGAIKYKVTVVEQPG